MKKKSNTSKSKVTQIKQKKSKLGKKKLGMGLSSLLSTDTALDSIIGKNTDDLDLGNSIQKDADKIKKVFKKEPPVKSATTNKPKVVKPIQLPKRRVREVQEVTELPIIVNETKLMPMTEEQVEIVELKNNFVASVAYIQAIFILGLVGFILYIYHKNKKKKIVSDKVLKL